MMAGSERRSGKRPAPVIAIDGPAGAGKSTAARLLAARLRYRLLDTGALYRAVALAASERGVDWADAKALGELAKGLRIEFEPDEKGVSHLLLEGLDRSVDIRKPEISRGASDVSRHPSVRAALLGLQRELGARGGVVMEGRDVGTEVFPDAEVKIFLTADPRKRAERRHREQSARGVASDLEQTLRRIRERDEQDRTREAAPLRPAADAVTVDTGEMGIEQMVDALTQVVRERGFADNGEGGRRR